MYYFSDILIIICPFFEVSSSEISLSSEEIELLLSPEITPLKGIVISIVFLLFSAFP